MQITEVRSKREIDEVLALPRRLYADDPAWVAPLAVLERRTLRNGLQSGRMRLFTARRGGEVVGTISALRDRSFEHHKGEKVAWFGYFETVRDRAVADALFDRASAAAHEWGADLLRGPRNASRFEYVGLTVEGHDRPPPMLQGHHPPWYADLVQGAGLRKHHDVLAYETALVDASGHPLPIPEALAARSEACTVPGLTVRAARHRSLYADLVAAHRVLDGAYRTVPDVAPMPLSTFVSVGGAYLTVANMELLQIAFVDGQPAAFAACLPEVNEALARADGRLLPGGWLRLARGLRHVRTAAFKLIGVMPEHRGSGLHAVLIRHVVEGAQRAGYTRMDGSVIDERNGPMRAVVEGLGMQVWRRYRFFERAV